MLSSRKWETDSSWHWYTLAGNSFPNTPLVQMGGINNAGNEKDPFSIFLLSSLQLNQRKLFPETLPQTAEINLWQHRLNIKSSWQTMTLCLSRMLGLSVKKICHSKRLTCRAVEAVAIVTWPALAGKWSLGVITNSVLMAPAWLALIYVCRQTEEGGRGQRTISYQHCERFSAFVASFYGQGSALCP